MSVCPVCDFRSRAGANFCSRCGHPIPISVGEQFLFGVRFPTSEKVKPSQAASVSAAERAPVYQSFCATGARWHVALYDRARICELATLYSGLRLSFDAASLMSLVEHTVDGGFSFFTGPSFWSCLANRMAGVPLEAPMTTHQCKCHSIFGCAMAQHRQHEMYHRDGTEVFYHLRDGFFPGGSSDETMDAIASGHDSRRVGGVDYSLFAIDRSKVKNGVLAVLKKYGASRCPMFSLWDLDRTVKALPGIVDLGRHKDWSFIDCPINGPGVRWKCY